MADYKELITGCFEDFMASEEFETIMRKRVAKCMEDAIEDSFRWGDLQRAVKAKVNEILVPYIERYDMEAYTAKLDVLLSDIAEHTAIADNKRILENFGALMVEPDKREITLEDVFEEYKRFVANAASGSGIEVEDGSYLPVDVACEIVERNDRGFGYRWEEVLLHFTADVPCEDERNDLSIAVELHRWSSDPADKFRLFRPAFKPTIDSLVRMNDFDVFLARLDRGFVRITGIQDMSDEVDIKAEPEYELR